MGTNYKTPQEICDKWANIFQFGSWKFIVSITKNVINAVRIDHRIGAATFYISDLFLDDIERCIVECYVYFVLNKDSMPAVSLEIVEDNDISCEVADMFLRLQNDLRNTLQPYVETPITPEILEDIKQDLYLISTGKIHGEFKQDADGNYRLCYSYEEDI